MACFWVVVEAAVAPAGGSVVEGAEVLSCVFAGGRAEETSDGARLVAKVGRGISRVLLLESNVCGQGGAVDDRLVQDVAFVFDSSLLCDTGA